MPVPDQLDRPGSRTLVLGGARSGKTRHAERLLDSAAAVTFIATSGDRPDDPEWTSRVAAHRASRPETWRTVETTDVAAALDAAKPGDVLLIDCVSLWLAAILDESGIWTATEPDDQERANAHVDEQIDRLVEAWTRTPARVVAVSNEVGSGIVPETVSGRRYRDDLGWLNTLLADSADEVVFVVAGIPVDLRGGWPNAAASAPRTSAAPAASAVTGEPTTQLAAPAPALTAPVPAPAPGPSGEGLPAPLDLDALATQVGLPDETAREAAQQRQGRLTKPTGALGRLEDLSIWMAAAQGQNPPRLFQRVRVVIFAGDHGVARSGVSAYPPEVTAQMVRNFVAGGAAVNVLARQAGATVRVLDISVDSDLSDLPLDVTAHKVRRGSGDIAHEPALSREEAERAFSTGMAIADEEVDSGADLLIPGDMGIGNTTVAAALVAVLTGSEVAGLVGRGTGIDDRAWMTKCAAVRDAARRGRFQGGDMIGLLAEAGGADVAAMAGFLLQAAIRRTPVLLDGVVSGAAALVAHRVAYPAREWWLAGHRSTEPAHTRALEQLGLEPIVDYGLRLGEGTGALVALPVLQAAVATLAEMATFDEAGVSDRDEA
jgi:nicotinate-nucleotide--dimethylbenzimidazole phosphoribosyltransferase